MYPRRNIRNENPCSQLWENRDALNKYLAKLKELMEPNGIPRRNRLDLCEPAELAIRNAVNEVEKMGADVRLTDAVVLLDKARNLVADYIDNIESTPPASREEEFQARVHNWMRICFGTLITYDQIERNHRFLEEAIELVQSTGCTKEDAHMLVDYVFGRPKGEVPQEIGGVMVTLAALCNVGSYNINNAAENELARIWEKVDQIREKQKSKPRNSPLPAPPQAKQVP